MSKMKNIKGDEPSNEMKEILDEKISIRFRIGLPLTLIVFAIVSFILLKYFLNK